MSAPGQQPGMFAPDPKNTSEPRSVVPWVVAGGFVAIVVLILVLAGRRSGPSNPGGPGLAPADSYAASLPITSLKMSQAGSMTGGQYTYLDGQITNKGSRTVTGVTVQVAFWSFTKQIVQKETVPLSLIRMREPYVDTEPVSASPIAPGQTRDFRLIFDHVAEDWNQNYPEIRIIGVSAR